MKKYLVVSDNHGNRDILVDIAERYRGQVTQMFHCGDSELAPTDSLWQDFLVVTGNCDYDERFAQQQVYQNELETIYMTHGHQHNVRQGVQNLAYSSAEVGATIVLFGHTHILGAEVINHVLYVNPGSICLPRGRHQIKTYAIIESNKQEFNVQYYDEQHKKVPNLSYVLSK